MGAGGVGGGFWLSFEQGLPGAEQCWLKIHLLTAPFPHTSQVDGWAGEWVERGRAAAGLGQ